MIWDYLYPKDGAVIPGLEAEEVIYAKDQPEYLPLRTITSPGPRRKVTSRWTLTQAQRDAIMDGADIFLTLYTFSQPLQPISLAIGDDDGVKSAAALLREE